jgi:hypothetical protein
VDKEDTHFFGWILALVLAFGGNPGLAVILAFILILD